MPVFDRGDLVRFPATFLASGGAIGDPSQIWFLYQQPNGVTATHRYGLTPSAIVRAGTGGYYIDLDIEVGGGDWVYRWEATGYIQAAIEDRFGVNQSFKP